MEGSEAFVGTALEKMLSLIPTHKSSGSRVGVIESPCTILPTCVQVKDVSRRLYATFSNTHADPLATIHLSTSDPPKANASSSWEINKIGCLHPWIIFNRWNRRGPERQTHRRSVVTPGLMRLRMLTPCLCSRERSQQREAIYHP